MKLELSYTNWIVLLIFSLIFYSCTNDSEVGKKISCRVISYELKNGADASKSTIINQLSNKYSADGKPVEKIYTSLSRDNNGGLSQNNQSSTSYTFNGEGLLMMDSTSASWSVQSTVDVSTAVSRYKYENGKLVEKKTHSKGTVFGQLYDVSVITSYLYDADENVIQESTTSDDQKVIRSSKTDYQWKDRKIEKITETHFDGTVIIPLIETNSKGLIVRQKSANFDNRYEYDNEGNVIKSEVWENGKLSSYRTSVFDTKNPPSDNRDLIEVGHPDRSVRMYGNKIPTRNLLKQEYISFDLDGNQRHKEEVTYSYEYNSSGFPLKCTRTETYQGVTKVNYTDYTYSCK